MMNLDEPFHFDQFVPELCKATHFFSSYPPDLIFDELSKRLENATLFPKKGKIVTEVMTVKLLAVEDKKICIEFRCRSDKLLFLSQYTQIKSELDNLNDC
jgi:hypothetical protein